MPTEHLVCYFIEFKSVGSFASGFVDQFQNNQFALNERKFLCVPSEKEEVVQTLEQTWGRMKSIYR